MSDHKFIQSVLSLVKNFLQKFLTVKKPLEAILGAIVILIAFLFFLYAYSTGNVQQVKGYTVTANFYKIGGLDKGSNVRISGIRVGSVIDLKLDMEKFSAILIMSIKPEVNLPSDTQASIVGSGLLGRKYVKLTPGRSEKMIEKDDKGIILHVKEYQSLEDSVGDIIFSVTN